MFTITNAMRSSTTVVLPKAREPLVVAADGGEEQEGDEVVKRMETQGVRRPGCTLENTVGITPGPPCRR